MTLSQQLAPYIVISNSYISSNQQLDYKELEWYTTSQWAKGQGQVQLSSTVLIVFIFSGLVNVSCHMKRFKGVTQCSWGRTRTPTPAESQSMTKAPTVSVTAGPRLAYTRWHSNHQWNRIWNCVICWLNYANSLPNEHSKGAMQCSQGRPRMGTPAQSHCVSNKLKSKVS